MHSQRPFSRSSPRKESPPFFEDVSYYRTKAYDTSTSEGYYASYGTNLGQVRTSSRSSERTTHQPACLHHGHQITCRTSEERRTSKSSTYVYRDSKGRGERREAKKRREVINRSRKCCNIVRHVAEEYPARLIHTAKMYSSHATMHLLPPLRAGLSRAGGFTKWGG